MKTGLMTHREGFCTGTAKSVSRYDIYLTESRFTGISVYRCTPTWHEVILHGLRKVTSEHQVISHDPSVTSTALMV